MLNSGLSFSSGFLAFDFFGTGVDPDPEMGEGDETVLLADSEECAVARGSSSFNDCSRFNASINLLMFVPYSWFTLNTRSLDSTLSFHHLFINKVFCPTLYKGKCKLI
jgi:hypothetical protein